MSMNNQRSSFIDLNWRITTCALGYVLLGITYGYSLCIPPLRGVVREYETTATVRSKVIVTFVSVITLTVVLIGVQYYTDTVSPATIVFAFVAWLAVAYFVLSMYSAYRHERNGAI